MAVMNATLPSQRSRSENSIWAKVTGDRNTRTEM